MRITGCDDKPQDIECMRSVCDLSYNSASFINLGAVMIVA